jgi:hypothetical protein
MVQQPSVLEESFNQPNATPVTTHVLSVLDLALGNALHVKLVFTLRDGRVLRLLEQVTWLNMVLVNQRQYML